MSKEVIEARLDELNSLSARYGIWLENVEIKKGISAYNIAKNIINPEMKKIQEERELLKKQLSQIKYEQPVIS